MNVDKYGYGFRDEFPICDGLLNSMETTFGPSTQHWVGMILEESGAVGELEKSENGRALLRLILNHYSPEQKIYKLLQEMRDEEKMKEKTAKGWNEDLDDELIERKSDQQYGTVVKSPNKVVHALKSEHISSGDMGTTLCGKKFITNNASPIKLSSKEWELYEDFFFCPERFLEREDTYCITCKRCRKLEIERMKREILHANGVICG